MTHRGFYYEDAPDLAQLGSAQQVDAYMYHLYRKIDNTDHYLPFPLVSAALFSQKETTSMMTFTSKVTVLMIREYMRSEVAAGLTLLENLYEIVKYNPEFNIMDYPKFGGITVKYIDPEQVAVKKAKADITRDIVTMIASLKEIEINERRLTIEADLSVD